MIDEWRDEIRWLTLQQAIVLLKQLGYFESDKVIANCRGYCHISIFELLEYFSENEYCVNICPVYFEGGPVTKRYKGTLLTVVLDRILLTAYEKGAEFVWSRVEYAKGFGTIDTRNHDRHSAYCI